MQMKEGCGRPAQRYPQTATIAFVPLAAPYGMMPPPRTSGRSGRSYPVYARLVYAHAILPVIYSSSRWQNGKYALMRSGALSV